MEGSYMFVIMVFVTCQMVFYGESRSS